ncbi:MAG: Ku protein [Planctomycetia bacterium]|nr:Ku protein [Planctomycetia bacterium]
MPHFSWKTLIRLSLVTVPVRGYNASLPGDGELHFNQLHKSCKNRIRYTKTCPVHGEVSNDEIVSGYEYAKGQYAVIDRKELDELRPSQDREIALDTFVPMHAIAPLYLDGRNYYLIPDGKVAEKAYRVLFRAMEASQVAAMAEGVVAGKEELMLLWPSQKVLVLSMLHHQAELRQPADLEEHLGEGEVKKEELRLAQSLISASVTDEFDVGKYKDSHLADVKKLIAAKVKGKKVAIPDVPDQGPAVINILDALKRSLANGGKKRPTAKARSARSSARRKRA